MANKTPPRGVSAEAQRARILDWLLQRALDTVEGYIEIGALHVPRRIMELRRSGHPIKMRWIYRFGPDGERHRVGQYYLEEPPAARQIDLVDMMLGSAA